MGFRSLEFDINRSRFNKSWLYSDIAPEISALSIPVLAGIKSFIFTGSDK